MIPLLDRSAHARLLQLRDEMTNSGLQNIGDVFGPIGPDPDDPRPAPFRILYVGRALRAGPHDSALDDYDNAVAWSTTTVHDYLVLRDPSSSFWAFIRSIVTRSLKALGHDPGSIDLEKVVGWSNLAKISDIRCNPCGTLLNDQADLCAELLRAEIARAKPTIILVAVGDYARQEVLHPVFGSDGWLHDAEKENQNAKQLSHPLASLVLWTNHPQGKGMGGPGYLKKSRAFCTDAIVSALRGGQ